MCGGGRAIAKIIATAILSMQSEAGAKPRDGGAPSCKYKRHPAKPLEALSCGFRSPMRKPRSEVVMRLLGGQGQGGPQPAHLSGRP